jgi:hypothetical protein
MNGMYDMYDKLEPIRPPPNIDFVQKRKDYTPMELLLINKITNEKSIADILQPPLFMNLTIEQFINKWKEIKDYKDDVVMDIYNIDAETKYTQQQIGIDKIENAIIKDITNDTLGTLYYDLSKAMPLPMTIDLSKAMPIPMPIDDYYKSKAMPLPMPIDR